MEPQRILTEFVPDTIWTWDYPVHYFGIDLSARMTVLRLQNESLIVHSPGPIGPDLAQEIKNLGQPSHIIAPGSFHYLHVAEAQSRFPEAITWICPGIESKQPDLSFDWILSDRASEDWNGEIEQVLVRGTRFMSEVAFFHRSSKTLLLVDLIENIGDATPGTDWKLKLWWKGVFHMWNTPKPAPEYQLGWKDKKAAAKSLNRILDWDFQRIVISHGENIHENAKDVARQAWLERRRRINDAVRTTCSSRRR